MSSPAVGSGAPPLYDGGGANPFARRPQKQKQEYSFSGRVLLTAVVILAILTVVFVLLRLLLYQFVARDRGGLAAGVRRSFGSLGRSGRRGLDASALAALPVTAYRRKPQQADGGGSAASASTSADGPTECAVCLSELADGEKVRALPSCGHVFHVECVDAWLRSRTTCPMCRAEVRPKQGTGDARPPAPALFGAGGTLVVTVEGGGAETRAGLRGQPAGAVV
ncbi:RING-H2 finger protein ATL44-like [Panicum miliaceum]|uniref:RING-type E3 ubiquitin transferase n=1 Tax=Panicum miliaceum TaxID=4540 RepID=A0A3L6SMH8_PANMI|nr:RING-H2 finger protein ATL44-like [Panicum miliaceum]